jgi:uncharacterized repeat protein (TIGR01451 family)
MRLTSSRLCTTVVFAVATVSFVNTGSAAVLIQLTESGGNILVTTSGSLDTSGLGAPDGSTSNTVRFRLNSGTSQEFIAFGVGAQDYWFNPPSFSFTDNGLADDTASTSATLTSGGGDIGFRPTGLIWLPQGYVSGTAINQVITISGVSFASLGLESGDSATYSWGGTNPDSITFLVGTAASGADLSITKTAPDPPGYGAGIGDHFDYLLTVDNNGPGGATGVVVTDTLPDELTFVTSDCGIVEGAPGELTWSIGALANGGSASCTLTVAIAGYGEIANTAFVSGNEQDGTPGNDDDTFVLQLDQAGIPTLGGVGLILLGALVGLSGVLVMRRWN